MYCFSTTIVPCSSKIRQISLREVRCKFQSAVLSPFRNLFRMSTIFMYCIQSKLVLLLLIFSFATPNSLTIICIDTMSALFVSFFLSISWYIYVALPIRVLHFSSVSSSKSSDTSLGISSSEISGNVAGNAI